MLVTSHYDRHLGPPQAPRFERLRGPRAALELRRSLHAGQDRSRTAVAHAIYVKQRVVGWRGGGGFEEGVDASDEVAFEAADGFGGAFAVDALFGDSLVSASTSDFRNERSSARLARGSASSPEPSPLDRCEPRQPAQAQHERDEEVQPQPEHVVGVVDPQCLLEDPEA